MVRLSQQFCGSLHMTSDNILVIQQVAIQSTFISTRGELIASRDDLYSAIRAHFLFILDAIKNNLF